MSHSLKDLRREAFQVLNRIHKGVHTYSDVRISSVLKEDGSCRLKYAKSQDTWEYNSPRNALMEFLTRYSLLHDEDRKIYHWGISRYEAGTTHYLDTPDDRPEEAEVEEVQSFVDQLPDTPELKIKHHLNANQTEVLNWAPVTLWFYLETGKLISFQTWKEVKKPSYRTTVPILFSQGKPGPKSKVSTQQYNYAVEDFLEQETRDATIDTKMPYTIKELQALVLEQQIEIAQLKAQLENKN